MSATIERIENEDAVMDAYQSMNTLERFLSIRPPPSPLRFSQMKTADMSPEEVEQACVVQRLFSRPDLSVLLEKAFGPPDAKLVKQSINAVFGFSFKGEMVLVTTEASIGRSNWVWIPSPADTIVGTSFLTNECESDDFRVAHFWPEFVDALMTALGQPIPRPDLTFGSNSAPGARYAAHKLEEVFPADEPEGKRPPGRRL